MVKESKPVERGPLLELEGWAEQQIRELSAFDNGSHMQAGERKAMAKLIGKIHEIQKRGK